MQTTVLTQNSIATMVQTVIALVVIAVFVMAIVSFLLAIWDFIRSEGEEERKQQGWNRIRYMMIGMFLIIVFLILFPIALNRLGIVYYDMFTAPRIFARMSEILNYLLSLGTYMQTFYSTGSFGSPLSSPAHNSYTL